MGKSSAPCASKIPSVKARLFSSGKTDSRCKGSALASRKLPEIWRVDIVHHNVRVFVAKRVDHLDARRPQVSAKGELSFERQVQVFIRRKTR